MGRKKESPYDSMPDGAEQRRADSSLRPVRGPRRRATFVWSPFWSREQESEHVRRLDAYITEQNTGVTR